MKKILSLAAAACVCIALAGCSRQEPQVLTCHVGGTMRPMMTKLVDLYTAQTGQKIEINSADSGELLAHIQGQQEGDLYVCHDPFIDTLMKKTKMGIDGWMIAELTPVIVVRRDNPKTIKGVADLARDDVDVWLTDYEHSTLGRMLRTIFTKAGVDFDKLNEDKKINTHRSGGYVANMVETGNADAGMCWNAVAALRREKLDVVPIAPEALPIPGVDTVTSATGKAYSLTPVRVTIATLTSSKRPQDARRFAEFVASDRAAAVIGEFGFTVVRPKKLYENGEALN